MKENKESVKDVKLIIEKIICEQISRLYPNDTKMITFFEIDNPEELEKLKFPEETEMII